MVRRFAPARRRRVRGISRVRSTRTHAAITHSYYERREIKKDARGPFRNLAKEPGYYAGWLSLQKRKGVVR